MNLDYEHILNEEFNNLSLAEIEDKIKVAEQSKKDAEACKKLYSIRETCINCSYDYNSPTDSLRYVKELDDYDNRIAQYNIASPEQAQAIIDKCNLVLKKLYQLKQAKQEQAQRGE